MKSTLPLPTLPVYCDVFCILTEIGLYDPLFLTYVTPQKGYKVSVRVASAIFTKFIGVIGRYAPVTAPKPRDLRKVLCFLSDPQNGLYYRLWAGL